ncbi:hypothetical protein BC936DRAFT_148731 [Jimgerdemannia flammicorona]|uniref:Uncharacterized protein n=1 Tax=Jimgerdemannia flammicorona TaxID=994334 RepID=A0A433D2F6_9FUNG|nr:hypothetical protein BC936DRAFT_148731 [Jimgerdemannia flammicorona]
MAVNSYDNVMRVYDRGLNPPISPSRLLHALKGFKNKNWPIKSSFYCGKECESRSTDARLISLPPSHSKKPQPRSSLDPTAPDPGARRVLQRRGRADCGGGHGREGGPARAQRPACYGQRRSVCLFVQRGRVFSLGGGTNQIKFTPNQNSAELMQRLEGHTDRVYAVHFHPTEPILASCSADFTVKIWGPTKKKNVG